MRFGAKAAWILCFAWCAWLTAGQVWLQRSLGIWTPDLGLVLLASLVMHSGYSSSLGLVFCLVSTRLAFSLEPPAALLAGGWMGFLLARSVAHTFDADQMFARAGAAFGAALLMGSWVLLAGGLRVGSWDQPGGGGVLELLAGVLTTAVATGLCALLLGPVFVRLPGLAPLRRPA
ncbi:MAG TPA: hypothetical protein EYQ25_11125 [Planctomycetes bacterium]|nr:hypothetical protein [Planctomycetota bacterium]HIL35944.1 hypothetical protein [Planctomycetota bacterium]